MSVTQPRHFEFGSRSGGWPGRYFDQPSPVHVSVLEYPGLPASRASLVAMTNERRVAAGLSLFSLGLEDSQDTPTYMLTSHTSTYHATGTNYASRSQRQLVIFSYCEMVLLGLMRP